MMRNVNSLLRETLRKNYFLDIIYQRFFKRKFFLLRKNTLKRIQDSRKWQQETLEKELNAKLNSILTHAAQQTSLYSSLLKNDMLGRYDINSLKSIPTMDKETITKNFYDLISRDVPVKNLIKRNTGGSTGEPFEFLIDSAAGYIDYAHHEFLYELIGVEEGDLIVGSGGLVIPEEKRGKGVFWEKNKRGSIWGDYIFSVLYVTSSNVGLYVDKLIFLQPAIMRGYPSFYAKLADYILANNIDISFNVKGVNLTSEVCSKDQKDKIELAFKTKVFFEYGHTEACVFAYTELESDNSTSDYKTSPLYGFVEVLNEKNEDTSIGEVGEVVVTGFCNTGMPFIRYRTGDLVRLSKRCGGYVEFSEIHGRSQDFIVDSNQEKFSLTALIFGQHFMAFKNIMQWQIYQPTFGEIVFRIIKRSGYSSKDEEEIREKIEKISSFNVSFEYVNEIEKTKRGKHLFLVKENFS